MNPSLSPELILAAYARGYFPMGDEEDGEIAWYDPDPRAIFPLDGLKVSRSLDKLARSGRWHCTANHAFDAVIAACGDRQSTWLGPQLVAAYRCLHQQGHAHSVEVWSGDRLVGGLYGVALGGAFMGESMFGPADAMKLALLALVHRLREAGFSLLDSQLPTEHWMRHGQILISRARYRSLLATAIKQNCPFAPHGPSPMPLWPFWRTKP